MSELTMCMAGAILLLSVAQAGYIAWTFYEISQLRKTERRVRRLALAANAYLHTPEGDAVHEKARAWLLDSLENLIEEKECRH